jgi:hypothetical protein
MTIPTKSIVAVLGALTTASFAGTAKEVILPPPAPTTCNWFTGFTYGQMYDVGNSYEALAVGNANNPGLYVSELDFDMYTFHIGRDFDFEFLGFRNAAYFEVAYLDGEMTLAGRGRRVTPVEDTDSSVSGLSSSTSVLNLNVDIVPITFNYKIERTLFGALSAYATVGAGYAFLIADLNVGPASLALNGGGFYAQASTGLLYNINEDWEAYGGLRWLHLSSINCNTNNNIGDGFTGLELDDDFAWEIGVRHNF